VTGAFDADAPSCAGLPAQSLVSRNVEVDAGPFGVSGVNAVAPVARNKVRAATAIGMPPERTARTRSWRAPFGDVGFIRFSWSWQGFRHSKSQFVAE
jgi:hypothetical protein